MAFAVLRCALIGCVLVCASSSALAQSTGEVWGNVTIDWLASERLVYTLDVEPKVHGSTHMVSS